MRRSGLSFGMPTWTLRGGCRDARFRSGVRFHKRLSATRVTCNVQRYRNRFRVQGKRVRDSIQLHEVSYFISPTIGKLKSAAVYNAGGRKPNNSLAVEAKSSGIPWSCL